MASTKSSGRIAEVDSIRGLAAIGVIAYHMLTCLFAPGNVGGFASRLVNDNFWTLVDLFFVISGFIFCHVYVTDDGLPKAGTTVRTFSISRLARLYPLHVATLVIVAVLVAVRMPTGDLGGLHYDAYHFMLNLLMLQASGLEAGYSFNTSAWSLTAETLCYGIFLAIIMNAPRRLSAWSVALVLVTVVSQIGHHMLPVNIARGVVGFFVGVLLKRHLYAFARHPTWLLAMLTVLAVVLCKACGRVTDLNYGIRLSLTAWPLLLVVVMRPTFRRVLDVAPMRLLGDLSFSAYLLHVPVMLVALDMWTGGMPREVLPWAAPAYLVTVMLVSYASHRWFEQPVRRAITARWSRRSDRLSVVSSTI